MTKKININLEEETRIFKNFGEIDRFGTGINGDYSPIKYLKSGLGHTWIYDHSIKNNFWENRHRFYAFIIGKGEIGRFAFSLRER